MGPRSLRGTVFDPRSTRGGRIRRLSPRLVEYHYLRDERVLGTDGRKPAGARERTEVLLEVAAIIGLVEVLREQLEHPVVVGLVAELGPVDQDRTAAWPRHGR